MKLPNIQHLVLTSELDTPAEPILSFALLLKIYDCHLGVSLGTYHANQGANRDKEHTH